MSLKLRDIFNGDLDRVFSYKTGRLVIIKDLWLGCTHRLIQLLIIVYVIVYALIINEGYIKREFEVGNTVIVKKGG